MKNLTLILLCSMHFVLNTSSQNLLTEDFLSDPLDSIDNFNEWYRSGVNFAYNISIVSPGLEYLSYVGSGRGNTSRLFNDGEGDVVYKNLTDVVTSGAAYLSFMLRVDNIPASVTEGYCIAFNPNTGGTNLNTALHIRRTSTGSYEMGVRKSNNVAYAAGSYETGKTYLVVLKYAIIDGVANDSSSLYIFSSNLPLAEPSLPNASTTEGDDYTGQASVHLVNNYAQTGLRGIDLKIDGIRAGTSWQNTVHAPLTDVDDANFYAITGIVVKPNPFTHSTIIDFHIQTEGNVEIVIGNQHGKPCAILMNSWLAAGNHTVNWQGDHFPPGLYTCQIRVNGKSRFQKLVRM